MVTSGDNSVLEKLFVALPKLSDSELRMLATIMEQPGAGEALSRFVHEVLALREAERAAIGKLNKKAPSQPKGRRMVPSQPVPNVVSQAPLFHSEEAARKAFFTLLSDRNLFKSTQDVVETLNGSFPCKLKYDLYRKQGRARAIRACWGVISSLPGARRSRLLESFARTALADRKRSDEYSTLFQVLTAHD